MTISMAQYSGDYNNTYCILLYKESEKDCKVVKALRILLFFYYFRLLLEN